MRRTLPVATAAPYCRHENKVSLGFVEGFNNKSRVLQRRAYGLRDEKYLRLIPTSLRDVRVAEALHQVQRPLQ